MTATSSRRLPLARLAEQLAGAEAPDEALGLLVRGLIEATGADGGAVVLRSGDDYAVPIAETAAHGKLDGAAELLSDRVVRMALEGGEPVCVRDISLDRALSEATSIVSRRLRSLVCVPMRAGTSVLGAIYLGKRGADDPFEQSDAEGLQVLATMAVPLLAQLRRRQVASSDAVEDLILGESTSMVRVRELVRRVAPSTLSVLITGETGTGKDVVARAIHAASPRARKAMVALNCAAVPEGLLAAELFGARKGAFTGAISDRKGRIEQAHESTLFLDEVGDMPLPMQAMLLRALEERCVTRLGDESPRPVDFRLIAASHKDLSGAVDRGEFRRDLLFRLQEFRLDLPRLADRPGDVELLARLFLRQAEEQLGLPRFALPPATLRALEGHPWLGNVRELRAAMRRAPILADGNELLPAHLQLDPSDRHEPASVAEDLSRPLAEARDAFATRYVNAVLERHGGNREAAAAALGISLRSLYRQLSGS